MTNHITDYLRNCLTAKPELIKTLEGELKKEIFWKTREQQRLEAGLDAKDPKDPRVGGEDDDLVELDSDGGLVKQEDDKKKKKKKKQDPNEPPSDMLLEERVNAKLLQYKLKRLGIAVSLWEIFALFEFVNMRFAKMSYEPQRYHYVMFEHLYKAMTASDYKADMLNIEIEDLNKKGKKSGKKDTVKKAAKVSDDEEALSVAKDLNPGMDENENEQPVKPEENSSKKEAKSSSSSSSSSDKSDSDSDISDDSLCVSEREHRRMKKRDAKLAKLTYHQVKHIFSIDVKQLKNIPVLGKFIKDAKDL